MRMCYEPCNIDLDISDSNSRVFLLSIENPRIMSEFLNDLWNAINGVEENLYFSEADKSVKLDKKASFISNPFAVDINEKKIITKLYQDMQEICLEAEYETLTRINCNIIMLLDNISEKLPYPIKYNLEIDSISLFKNYSVLLDQEELELPERIINYIRLTHQILGTDLFVFFHLCDFLDEKKLHDFAEMVAYEQVTVLLLESCVELKTEGIKYCIIDADNCLIEY